MDTSEIKGLLEKYLRGTSTEEENAMLETWYIRYENKRLADVASQARIEQLDRIRQQVAQHIAPARTYKVWPRIVMAAAAVLLIVVGVLFFNSRHILNSVRDPAFAVNDIAPGKNGATIRLANGKMIRLSDAKSGVVVRNGKLAYNDGSSVGSRNEFGTGSGNSTGRGSDLRQDEVMQVMASTARGQTYEFTLPDGTKVWLNADSKLEFPSNFANSDRRNVKLSGEGYFEVATSYASLRGRRVKQSFTVETGLQSIEVLGTHFNVNSYSDEPETQTTLLEGSVRVIPKNAAAKTQVMRPGQQAILDKSFAIKLKEVTDLEYFIAWKAADGNNPGSLAFDNNTLDEVMRKVTRWYDVTVEYKGNVKRDIRFSGVIRRNVPLSSVLRLLEASTGSVKFKIQGRRLIVMN